MVFITIVTNKRRNILIDNIDILRKAIKTTKYDFEVIAGIVLDNHMHMILNPQNINEIPKIITSIKYYFSRNIQYINNNKTNSK